MQDPGGLEDPCLRTGSTLATGCYGLEMVECASQWLMCCHFGPVWWCWEAAAPLTHGYIGILLLALRDLWFPVLHSLPFTYSHPCTCDVATTKRYSREGLTSANIRLFGVSASQ